MIEEIHDLVINRQSGQGLGVSIAGGKGSPPYKGNDEVSVTLLRRYFGVLMSIIELLRCGIFYSFCTTNSSNITAFTAVLLGELMFSVFVANLQLLKT